MHNHKLEKKQLGGERSVQRGLKEEEKTVKQKKKEKTKKSEASGMTPCHADLRPNSGPPIRGHRRAAVAF